MNLAMLTTLAAILDRGSFAAAAQQVGCTPSAVSLQVKQLEAWFGQPLFDRSARIVKPTPLALEAGMVAREMITRLDALRARPAMAVAGRVRLGAIASVQSDALPQALRRLRDLHPALDIEVSPIVDSDPLLGALKAGQIDMAVLVRPQGGGSSRLVWQNLAKQPYVLLVPPGVAPGTPQDVLRRFNLIRYDPALTGGRLAAQYVRQSFPETRSIMDLRSIDAIVAMVSAGLGVSIVPQPRRALLQAHGVQELRLARSAPTRQIALVRRNADAGNRNLDAVARALAGVYA